jgi:hypothetical protein
MGHHLRAIEDKWDNNGYDIEEPISSLIPKRYGKDHVFDEDMSVNWNREKVEEKNRLYVEYHEDRRLRQKRKDQKLHDDMVAALQEDYGINKEQAEILLKFAYNEYHAFFTDVFNNLPDLVHLAQSFEKAGKQEGEK